MSRTIPIRHDPALVDVCREGLCHPQHLSDCTRSIGCKIDHSKQSVVNHPRHYGGDTVYETIKVIQSWLGPEGAAMFCRGNAIKYLSRAGKKGDQVEDLEKAAWYVNKELEIRKE